jgi:flagellar hook-basal body complex protein FliE
MISSYGLRPAGEALAPEMMPGVQAPLPLKGPSETNPAQPSQESFANVLGRMVEEVSAKQGASNNAVAALQSGQNVSLHQAVIAMEEANLSFQLMIEVRNKLLDSYQELMRMQV